MQPPDKTGSRPAPLAVVGCVLILLLFIFGGALALSRDAIDALILTGTLLVVIGVGVAGGGGATRARSIPVSFRLPAWALSIFWVLGPAFGLFLWRESARGNITGSLSDLVSAELWLVGGFSAVALVASLLVLSFSFSLLEDRLRHRSVLLVKEIRYEDLSAIEAAPYKSRGGSYWILHFKGRPRSRAIEIWATGGVYGSADIDWALRQIAERAPQVAAQAEAARSTVA
jgi:hypothetical protein